MGSVKTATRAAKMTSPFRIGFLVHDVSRMRRTAFDQIMKPLGITRAQWWALANLSRKGDEGMIQVELAKVLDVGKVTIGGLLDRLEASGHIQRRPSPSDRRVKHVFITEKGYSVLRHMEAGVGSILNRNILSGIKPENIHIAEDVLHAMKENLREILTQDE